MSDFWRNKKVRILLCIEILLIIVSIAGLFGKNELIVGKEDSAMLMEEGVSLSPGVYRLRCYYTTTPDAVGEFWVEVPDAAYKTLFANAIALYSGLNMRECEFYLSDSVDSLKAAYTVTDGGVVEGFELWSTNKGAAICLFWILIISFIVNAVAALVIINKKQTIPFEKKLVYFGIPLVILVASLPVMVDYNIMGGDILFHLLRIEALTQSIANGELAVRLQSMWLSGHGYASSIFYGDTCLFVAAFFRLIGFSLDATYRLFIVAVNLATALIAYVSFYKCFNQRMIALLGCVLYTLAPYRLYNIYNRSAVGEYTAMIFLPLLVWGFYKIYTEDTNKKGYLFNWVIPVIGFSGIIQSHVLSCEMSGAFVVLLCLFLWKKTFRKKTFIVLFMTVFMTLLINAWFLVPFIDLMMADKYYFNNQANVLIQSRGIFFAQILYTLQAAGSSSRFVENGMLDAEPIGLGVVLLAAVIVWPLIRKRISHNNSSDEMVSQKATGDIAFCFVLIALFMSTRYFPWDFLSKSHLIFATLVGSLQFPTRITTMTTILGTVVACVAGLWILKEEHHIFPGNVIIVGAGVIALLFSNFQMNDVLLTRETPLRLYSAQNLGSTAILGAEYLPQGTSVSHMVYHAPILSETVEMDAYEKDGLDVRAFLKSQSEGYVEFPMLFYKGYVAENSETKEALRVSKGDNGDVRVYLPKDFEGTVHVWYDGMWYHQAAEMLSLVTGMGLLVFWLCKKFRVFNRKTH